MERKQLTGTVVSNRMLKTVVVRVTRRVQHPVYKKVIVRARTFMADDAGLKPQVGDEVRMVETRPISKNKCWRLVAIVRKGPAPVVELA